MDEQMNKVWYEKLDKWVGMLQEDKMDEVIEEMHDLICAYEQS